MIELIHARLRICSVLCCYRLRLRIFVALRFYLINPPDQMKRFVRNHFEEFVNRRNPAVIAKNMTANFYDHDGPGGKPTGIDGDEKMMCRSLHQGQECVGDGASSHQIVVDKMDMPIECLLIVVANIRAFARRLHAEHVADGFIEAAATWR